MRLAPHAFLLYHAGDFLSILKKTPCPADEQSGLILLILRDKWSMRGHPSGNTTTGLVYRFLIINRSTQCHGYI